MLTKPGLMNQIILDFIIGIASTIFFEIVLKEKVQQLSDEVKKLLNSPLIYKS
jgi:hypothetical protein